MTPAEVEAAKADIMAQRAGLLEDKSKITKKKE